jgi:hypothetical protein
MKIRKLGRRTLLLILCAACAIGGYEAHPVRAAAKSVEYHMPPVEWHHHDCAIPALAVQIERLPALRPVHTHAKQVSYVMDGNVRMPTTKPGVRK